MIEQPIVRLARLIAGVAVFAMCSFGPAGAHAQTLGAFTWQLQPYCNRVTFVVAQNGPVFTLDGYDDVCGATRHHAAAGVASFNPGGTVNVGFTVTVPGSGGPLHVTVTLDVATLSGTWIDQFGYNGVFALNGAAAGNPHPPSEAGFGVAGGYFARGPFGGGFFFAHALNGTLTAPTAMLTGDTLGRYGAGGYSGGPFGGYNWPTGMMSMSATENWTPTSTGTALLFWTTPNASTNAAVRMYIDAAGSVGMGTQAPADRLDVNGDIRVGTNGTNGCLRNNNGGTITGVCASDARFKEDVAPLAPTLERLAALQPVQFSWRAQAFPDRGFGPAREAGLIAQDVEAVFPELVVTGEDGYKAVDYSRLPLVSLQAIRELHARNDSLAAENAALERRLAALEAAMRQRR